MKFCCCCYCCCCCCCCCCYCCYFLIVYKCCFCCFFLLLVVIVGWRQHIQTTHQLQGVGDVSKFWERGDLEAPIGEFQNPRLPLDPAARMDYADQGKGKRNSNSHFRLQNLISNMLRLSVKWLEYNQPIKDICLFCLLDFKHQHLIFLTRRDQNSISGEIWIAPCISYLPQRKIYFSKLLIVKIAKCVLCLFCIDLREMKIKEIERYGLRLASATSPGAKPGDFPSLYCGSWWNMAPLPGYKFRVK